MHHKILWEKAISRRSKLPLPVIAVLRALGDYANGDGKGARPGLALLAKGLGVSEKTVSRGLRAGENAGWVTKTGGGHATGGTPVAASYRLTIPSGLDVSGLNDPSRAHEGPHGTGALDRSVQCPEELSDSHRTDLSSVDDGSGEETCGHRTDLSTAPDRSVHLGTHEEHKITTTTEVLATEERTASDPGDISAHLDDVWTQAERQDDSSVTGLVPPPSPRTSAADAAPVLGSAPVLTSPSAVANAGDLAVVESAAEEDPELPIADWDQVAANAAENRHADGGDTNRSRWRRTATPASGDGEEVKRYVPSWLR